jgi:hypothetical protein
MDWCKPVTAFLWSAAITLAQLAPGAAHPMPEGIGGALREKGVRA